MPVVREAQRSHKRIWILGWGGPFMRRSVIVLGIVLGLAACSGGGGGGPAGSGSNSGSGTIPIVTATSMPDVKGFAVDETTGAAISGANVVISQSAVIAGATPPAATASPWPRTTTAPDGSFDVHNVAPSTWTMDFSYVGGGYPIYANAQWVQIFSSDGHAAYHGIASIATTGTTDLGRVKIALPTSTDLAWLAGINSDRANVGTPPVTTPLNFDSVTLQTARYWANQMASNGFFAHGCPPSTPSCSAFWLYETQHGSIPSSQNIAYSYSTWQQAESAFMAEQSTCPGGNWQTCTFSESTGHYISIMSANYWAGVGIATGKDPNTQTGSTTPYYVENFASPSGFLSVQSLLRSLEIK